MAYRGAFDGLHSVQTKASPTLLVRFDNNDYSVEARARGRPVDVCAYAERVVMREDGETVGEIPGASTVAGSATTHGTRCWCCSASPGRLRNGAPFKDWPLPKAMSRVRARLSRRHDGDRQMVPVLAAVLEDGLDAVQWACGEVLDAGTCSADVVLNVLARRRDPHPKAPPSIETLENLRLGHPPRADCQRCDRLSELGDGAR